jgi:hypothetical protein
MFANKLSTILNRAKRVLLSVVAIVLFVFFTALILDPNIVSNFVRFLVVAAIYGVVGVWAYTRRDLLMGGRQTDGLIVKTSGGALAELTIDSAREQILKAVKALPSVSRADVEIIGKYGKAVITLNVVMVDDGNGLLEKEKVIDKTLNEVVKKRLGLKMANRPVVQLRFSGDKTPLPAQESSASEESAEVPSPIDRLKSLLPGDKSDDNAVVKDKPAAEDVDQKEEKGQYQDKSDPTGEEKKVADEDSGEFWDFLRSTASTTPDESSVEESSSAEIEEVEESKGMTTALADDDASEEQTTTPLPPDDDEKKASSSQ